MTTAVPRFGAGACPTGCGRNVGTGHLMCGLCWSLVPHELRRPVYRTWAAYRRARTDTALDLAMVAYQAARDAAISSVR